MRRASPAAQELRAVRGENCREGDREWRSFFEAMELLVRQLIEQAERRGEPAEIGERGAAVILDLVVDGVRCVLSRGAAEAPETERVALSPRELEIARMVAKGYPNKVIARVLEISSWTVSTHLRRMFAKLGVSTRASMVSRLSDDSQFRATARKRAREEREARERR